MDDRICKEIDARYMLVCRKCRSENVTIYYEPAVTYSEYSGSGASISFACQECENDLVQYL